MAMSFAALALGFDLFFDADADETALKKPDHLPPGLGPARGCAVDEAGGGPGVDKGAPPSGDAVDAIGRRPRPSPLTTALAPERKAERRGTQRLGMKIGTGAVNHDVNCAKNV